MKLRTGCLASLFASLILAMALAPPLGAAVELRFDPADQTIPLSTGGSLSVMLDDTLDIRTIEVLAEYNPGVLLSVAGNPGQLFIDTGCQLFHDFDDDTPGEWYCAVIILGSDCWLTGPGELYRWDFEGIANGYSRIKALEVRLYDPQANLLEDVSLAPTYVFVGDGTAAPEPAPTVLELGLYPNPFNPGTRLVFSGAVKGSAKLEVFDLTGRRLDEIWQGRLDGGTLSVSWDGRDELGRELPSGVYLFRLATASGAELVRRGTLLK